MKRVDFIQIKVQIMTYLRILQIWFQKVIKYRSAIIFVLPIYHEKYRGGASPSLFRV